MPPQRFTFTLDPSSFSGAAVVLRHVRTVYQLVLAPTTLDVVHGKHALHAAEIRIRCYLLEPSEAQLATDHVSVFGVPGVVANRFPVKVDVALVVVTSLESQIT